MVITVLSIFCGVSSKAPIIESMNSLFVLGLDKLISKKAEGKVDVVGHFRMYTAFRFAVKHVYGYAIWRLLKESQCIEHLYEVRRSYSYQLDRK